MITIAKIITQFNRVEYSEKFPEGKEVNVSICTPERNLTDLEKESVIHTHSDSNNFYYYEIGEEDLVKNLLLDLKL